MKAHADAVAALLVAAACAARAAEGRGRARIRRRARAPLREPPGPCLPGQDGATSGELTTRAARAREGARHEAALACADEALVADPRDRAPLRERALSLAALDRDADARAALSRLLAADPDDPATLLVAADLHVTHFGDRDSLEAGLDLAVRGAARASSGPRADPSIAPRLLVLAGIAGNGLGRNQDALHHLEKAVALDPRDVDAQYERGVALFELCRFAPARRAFERVSATVAQGPVGAAPPGASRRAGRRGAAGPRFARACGAARAPRPARPGGALTGLVRDRATPGALRASRGRARGARRGAGRGRGIPAYADLTAVEPPLSPSILGLFRGPSLGEPCPVGDGPYCRSIVLYRRNLLRFSRDRAQLSEQVRVTLMHELGHLHGESDEGLRARGLE